MFETKKRKNGLKGEHRATARSHVRLNVRVCVCVCVCAVCRLRHFDPLEEGKSTKLIYQHPPGQAVS